MKELLTPAEIKQLYHETPSFYEVDPETGVIKIREHFRLEGSSLKEALISVLNICLEKFWCVNGTIESFPMSDLLDELHYYAGAKYGRCTIDADEALSALEQMESDLNAKGWDLEVEDTSSSAYGSWITFSERRN